MFIVIAGVVSGSGETLHTSINRIKEYENGNIKRVYLLKDGEEFSKLIQKVTNRGYKSNIEMYITINCSDNRIEDFVITDHSESENYGEYIEKRWFQKRFLEKDAFKKLKLVKMSAEKPEEVVGVTGATKSSKAVVEGVNMAFNNYLEIRGGLFNEKNY